MAHTNFTTPTATSSPKRSGRSPDIDPAWWGLPATGRLVGAAMMWARRRSRLMLPANVALWISSCTPVPTGVIPEAPSWDPPSVEPTEPPTTAEPPLVACDLTGFPIPPIAHAIASEDLLWGSIEGLPLGRLGRAVAVVTSPDAPPSLVVGAPSIALLPALYSGYSSTDFGFEFPAEIWVFDVPLPPGLLDRSATRSVLLSGEGSCCEGTVLTVGDVTGDGVDDLISAGHDLFSPAPYHIIEMPTPPGEHSLDEITIASFGARDPNYGIGAASVGDWDLDGVGDIAFGGAGDADPYDTLNSLEDNYFGAEVIPGPPTSAPYAGDIPADGAITWFDVQNGAPDEVGLYSTLIPDVTGDGAADLLVNGRMFGISYDGSATDSLLLFAGDVYGYFNYAYNLTRLHMPCEPDLTVPENVGDVTGDGRIDIAVRGPKADYTVGLDNQDGAIWLLSRLHELAEAQPDRAVSLTTHSDAILFSHVGEYLADVVGLDIDTDGQQDLAVLTSANLYLFRGPLLGIHDINEANLTLLDAGVQDGVGTLAAGDLSGDGIPDLVVGDPTRGDLDEGQVRIYSGAALLAALQ